MIGIFDSGVGGMTVAHAIEQTLPQYRQIYFGDLARTPYGSKSPETIRRYACQNIEFLIQRGARLIVIACNSAASVATDFVRTEYDLPIFDVIEPAVQKVRALSSCIDGKSSIGVIGTRATIQSGVYTKKIEELCARAEIFGQACPLLVPLVEEGWLHKRETKMIVRRYLAPLKKRQVTALVVACTHYPLLKHIIQPRIGNKVEVIDSSQELAATLKYYIKNNPDCAAKLAQGGDNVYYGSDVTEAAHQTARKIFGRNITLLKES